MDEIKVSANVGESEERVRQFLKLLHGRGMNLTKLGQVIGNATHSRISEAVRRVKGRGRDVRRRMIQMRVLTDAELEALGWVSPEQQMQYVDDWGTPRHLESTK